LSESTADLGTTGFTLLDREAIEPITPSRIKKPSTIARSDPMNVPAIIFKKFFICPLITVLIQQI
jgi:hypothetical protein